MHPTAGIRSLSVIETSCIQLLALLHIARQESAPSLGQALALAIYIRWAHDRNVDLVAMLSDGGIKDFLGVPVQGVIGK